MKKSYDVNKNKVNLNKVLREYYATKDGSIITEEVYAALTLYCNKIARRYFVNHPEFRDNDYLMSVCNEQIWRQIGKYDETRCRDILPFIYIVVDNAIKMDIRKNKKYKNTISIYESFYTSERTLSECYYIDTLIDDKSEDDMNNVLLDLVVDTIIDDSLNKVVNSTVQKRSAVSNIKNIMKEYLDGSSQYELAKKYNISQSYVCRLINRARKQISKELTRKGVI